MKVKMCTITDEGQEVWIDTYIDENKISVGWKIPSYFDKELNTIVYSEDLNLFIDGGQITVKSTELLLSILYDNLGSDNYKYN